MTHRTHSFVSACLFAFAFASVGVGTVGCSSAAPAEDRASSSAADTDGRSATRAVRFEIGAFIPCEHINFLGMYDADNRMWTDDQGAPHSSFGFDPSRSRIALRTVVTDANGTLDSESFVRESIRFDQDKGAYTTLGGDLDWCATFDPSNPPPDVKHGTASKDGIYAHLGGAQLAPFDDDEPNTSSITTLDLFAGAANGATPFPEWAVAGIDIDCQARIAYHRDEAGVEQPTRIDWSCSNTHFPSIEVYIDGVPIVLQDVLVQGRRPLELASPSRGDSHGTCRYDDLAYTWRCTDGG